MPRSVADVFSSLLQELLLLLAPVGLLWSALILLTALLWRRGHRRFAGATALLSLFITLIGGTDLPGRLLGSLERPYAGMKPEDFPAADAVVLLGGGAQAARYEVAGVHLSPAGDRLAMAAELMRLGKAPVLLLGGARWKLDGRESDESAFTKELLIRWGVAPEAMIPLGSNRDTHDEALKVRALAAERGWKHVLLVTSANHMRRASAVFRHIGLEVTPAPCNFLTSVGLGEVPFHVGVPGSDGFAKTGIWLHEEIGWLVYRWRGWL